MNCACGKRLSWGNKSGKCRPCLNADPDYHARKAAAIRRAFQHHPELQTKRANAIAEANRRPERRAQSGEQARALRIWEKGLPATKSPDAIARQVQTMTERKLAHIPLAYRDEYRRLTRKYGAAEATRLILDHAQATARRAYA